MDYNWYMSEVRSAKEVKMSPVDSNWFRYVMSYEIKKGNFSSYDIYKFLKENSTKNTAYKIIHQRIAKLYSIGFLDEIREENYRRARKFKISINGWINGIMDGILNSDSGRNFMESQYDKNIIFKTFLEPYFELSTIKSLNQMGSLTLVNYLNDCCRGTLRVIESDVEDRLDHAIKHDTILSINELDLIVKSFIFLFALDSTYKGETREYEVKDERGKVIERSPYDESRKMYLAIVCTDKKFLNSLTMIRSSLNESYKIIVDFKKELNSLLSKKK